jgi:hypothetical protein
MTTGAYLVGTVQCKNKNTEGRDIQGRNKKKKSGNVISGKIKAGRMFQYNIFCQ